MMPSGAPSTFSRAATTEPKAVAAMKALQLTTNGPLDTRIWPYFSQIVVIIDPGNDGLAVVGELDHARAMKCVLGQHSAGGALWNEQAASQLDVAGELNDGVFVKHDNHAPVG